MNFFRALEITLTGFLVFLGAAYAGIRGMSWWFTVATDNTVIEPLARFLVLPPEVVMAALFVIPIVFVFVVVIVWASISDND